MNDLSRDQAQQLLGDDLIGPDTVEALFGAAPNRAAEPPIIPFSPAEVQAARQRGCLLVYRPREIAPGVAVTLGALFERCAERAAHGGCGFRPGTPWFLAERFARHEVAAPGWALVSKAPWKETLNLTFDMGSEALALVAGKEAWRRRRAVEIAFDCLVVALARGTRLLENAWDWSSSESADGGLVNVGAFNQNGLEVLSYSRPVRHGALGICPTLVRGS